MNKRKWSRTWKEDLAAGLALLLFALGCGFLAQVTAESQTAVIALTSRATR